MVQYSKKVLVSLFLVTVVIGCGESSNRVVDIDADAVPALTPAQSQAAADADLPKT